MQRVSFLPFVRSRESPRQDCPLVAPMPTLPNPFYSTTGFEALPISCPVCLFDSCLQHCPPIRIAPCSRDKCQMRGPRMNLLRPQTTAVHIQKTHIPDMHNVPHQVV